MVKWVLNKKKWNDLHKKLTDIFWYLLHRCVQWFLEEEPSISFDRLYEQVNEQWLLSDLADSGMACIPPEIFNIKQSQIIDGTFQLQLQCLINIGSIYLKFHHMRFNNISNCLYFYIYIGNFRYYYLDVVNWSSWTSLWSTPSAV